MNSRVILVDFGASRIKSVVWSLSKNNLVDSVEVPSPNPIFGANGEVEVEPEKYWNCLEATAGVLLKKYPDIEELWICSEMHGALIIDKNGVPLTRYISWRDERVKKSKPSTLQDESAVNSVDEFLELTGLKLRAGLPCITIPYVVRQSKISGPKILCAIVDWLLYRGGEHGPKIHSSLAAGTGFYSLVSNAWINQSQDSSDEFTSEISFPQIAKIGEVLGQINLCGHRVNVYGGVGDMQAALQGAGFLSDTNLLINLGTGSQVVKARMNSQIAVDRRISCNEEIFSAITHIPSGRALNVYAQFIDSCSTLGGGKPIFWNIFQSLTVDEVISSQIEVDLNVFEAAWKFEKGGEIAGIRENQFMPKSFIAGLIKSWLSQYAKAINFLDPEGRDKEYKIAGGLARRASFILPTLDLLTGLKGSLATTVTGEETLDGLLKMALTKHAH